jgi:hypothetical protein
MIPESLKDKLAGYLICVCKWFGGRAIDKAVIGTS